MKKTIGWVLVITAFVIVMGATVISEGLYEAMVSWGIAIILTCMFVGGLKLITDS